MERSSVTMLFKALLVLLGCSQVPAAELQDFSLTLSSIAAGATDVTYTFEYTIVTANPSFVFYALANSNAMDTSAIGNPIDLNKVRVEIDGAPAAIAKSYNYGTGLYIGLQDRTLAKAGAHIKVELKGVRNRDTIGSFTWEWIHTANGAGWEIDGVSNPPPLKFVSDELQDFSLALSSIAAGATDVTYTFEYTIVTANPYDVFYALANSNAIDTSAIGNPIELDKVRVEINGVPAAIDNRGQNSYNYGTGLFIRLQHQSLAKAGAQIKVEIKGVKNRDTIGSFTWHWIRTSNSAGWEIDGVSNPPPLKFVSDELQDFSLTLSNNAAGATDVTYTFEYTIVTANPYFVFYALAHSNAINTSAIGNPIDLDKVRVEINGAPAAIDNRGQNSYNYGTGLFIRLHDQTLAKAGAHIKVELKGVRNRNTIGSFTWQWIHTANRAGWEIDGVSNPPPLKFVAQHTTPKSQTTPVKGCDEH